MKTYFPNPFMEDFIRCDGKPCNPAIPYSRKPLAVDVGEGKTGPIYTAHSYHTKVPHKAIMRAILHDTCYRSSRNVVFWTLAVPTDLTSGGELPETG